MKDSQTSGKTRGEEPERDNQTQFFLVALRRDRGNVRYRVCFPNQIKEDRDYLDGVSRREVSLWKTSLKVPFPENFTISGESFPSPRTARDSNLLSTKGASKMSKKVAMKCCKNNRCKQPDDELEKINKHKNFLQYVFYNVPYLISSQCLLELL